MENIGFPFDFEDTYSHGKRLHFIKEAIENYCQKNNQRKEEIKILDIGCGTDIGTTFPLASLGYSIIGVDIDKDSIHYAKTENIYSNASFENGFLDKMPHLSSFDVIVCSEVLEHVTDTTTFLLLLKSRLKSDGIIILTVPNGYGWFEFEKFIYEKLELRALFKFLNTIIHVRKIINSNKSLPPTTLNKKDKHLQRFTYKRLKSFFKKADLNIIRESRGGVFGGQISEILFGRFALLLKFNNWLGTKLPAHLSIDWYFVLKSFN